MVFKKMYNMIIKKKKPNNFVSIYRIIKNKPNLKDTIFIYLHL